MLAGVVAVSDEEWRRLDILGSEYEYFGSSHGRVKRLAATIAFANNGGLCTKSFPERVLKQQTNNRGSGYHIITLQLGGGAAKKHTFQVAPLICRAWHGPPPREGMHCAHLNGDSRDNRPANLAWVEPVENEAHKLAHGTRMRGERHHQAKLTAKEVRAIRASADVQGIDLAEMYGVSASQVSDIRTGKSWAHLA